jgi:uncharacterized membrane protein
MSTQTVAAVFDRYEDAAAAVSKLEAAGVTQNDISIVSNDPAERDRYGARTDTAQHAANGAGTGATVGTAVGAGAGLLAGLGMLAIPGVGPVVAAGWLVATLVGAGAGAAAGGLLGSLTGAGVSETDAHSYAEAVHRGGTLVTVRTNDANYDHVVSILDVDGAVDLDQRESAWRSEGWNGQYTGATERAAGASSVGSELGVTDPATDPYVAGAPGAGIPAARPRVRTYPQS